MRCTAANEARLRDLLNGFGTISPVVPCRFQNSATIIGRSQSRGIEDAMRQFNSIDLLGDGLAEEAQRLREKAANASSARDRETLLRRARQAETAAHVDEWVSSRGLQPPN